MLLAHYFMFNELTCQVLLSSTIYVVNTVGMQQFTTQLKVSLELIYSVLLFVFQYLEISILGR